LDGEGDDAFDAGLLCFGGVDRLDLANQLRGGADDLGGDRRRRGRGGNGRRRHGSSGGFGFRRRLLHCRLDDGGGGGGRAGLERASSLRYWGGWRDAR
jgi:hypothetical protein